MFRWKYLRQTAHGSHTSVWGNGLSDKDRWIDQIISSIHLVRSRDTYRSTPVRVETAPLKSTKKPLTNSAAPLPNCAKAFDGTHQTQAPSLAEEPLSPSPPVFCIPRTIVLFTKKKNAWYHHQIDHMQWIKIYRWLISKNQSLYFLDEAQWKGKAWASSGPPVGCSLKYKLTSGGRRVRFKSI